MNKEVLKGIDWLVRVEEWESEGSNIKQNKLLKGRSGYGPIERIETPFHNPDFIRKWI